jgi:hypothetical protein
VLAKISFFSNLHGAFQSGFGNYELAKVSR